MAEWKTYKIIKKVASGITRSGTYIDLKTFSAGHGWKGTKIGMGISNITVQPNTNKIELKYSLKDDSILTPTISMTRVVHSNPTEVNAEIFCVPRHRGKSAYTSMVTGNKFTVTGDVGTFAGEGSTNAYITAEVYRDGKLIRTIVLIDEHYSSGGSGYRSSHNAIEIEYPYNVSVRGYVKGSMAKRDWIELSASVIVKGETVSLSSTTEGEVQWIAFEN